MIFPKRKLGLEVGQYHKGGHRVPVVLLRLKTHLVVISTKQINSCLHFILTVFLFFNFILGRNLEER